MEHSPSRDETVLVTGGSGYLGGWCIDELLERATSVRTTVRNLAREPKSARRSAPGRRRRSLTFSRPICSDDGWTEAVAGCDYVLHVASPFPRSSRKTPTS